MLNTIGGTKRHFPLQLVLKVWTWGLYLYNRESEYHQWFFLRKVIAFVRIKEFIHLMFYFMSPAAKFWYVQMY